MNKALFYSILIIIIGIGPVRAQDSKEKIESMRVAYLTRELNITTHEAQQFWPVYNEYQDQLEALRKIRRQQVKKANADLITDKEAEQFVDYELNFRQREAEIQKQYYTRFKQILPIKKVAQLIKSEENFKKELIRQLKEKNQ